MISHEVSMFNTQKKHVFQVPGLNPPASNDPSSSGAIHCGEPGCVGYKRMGSRKMAMLMKNDDKPINQWI